MKDDFIGERLREGLSGLYVTERQHRQMLDRIINGGKTKMKKKISASLILAMTLTLLSITGALAATGAFEKILEVWHSSFAKMNTTGTVETLNEEEARQAAEALAHTKEDLILSTVPGEGDLDYDAAFAIARRAILDTFGTPEAELDAMGVYPSFYNTPFYEDGEDELYKNEWEFYITPRRDVNIDEDHAYEAPGEYMVRVASPSGEVTDIFWYIDAFWPDYALRAWNAGKRDYVYSKAVNGSDFYQLPLDQQELFLTLFREAGYSLETDYEALLNRLWVELNCAEREKNLLSAGTPAVENAVSAVEEQFGFTREQMERYGFNLLPSPLASETEDYVLCLNYNFIYSEPASPQNPTGGAGRYALAVYRYPQRLGYFLVRLDRESKEAAEVIHVNWTGSDPYFIPSGLLLGRRNWTVADLEAYEPLRQLALALDRAVAEGTKTEAEADAEFLDRAREMGANTDAFYWLGR